MSSAIGRLFSGLTRVAFSRGISKNNISIILRLNSTRSLAVSSHLSARSNTPKEDEEVNSEPIKFSTSMASHKTWKVDRSMGSHYERPLWKVLPISLVCTAFLLWCVLREETDIDAQLEKQLFEQLPGLISDEELDKIQEK
ncbi:protein CCSMST1 [Melanotaenia boesemani]|uniref:protein CCSMST1 n=1 Tax=Melanotaenia boesemani TaxID=1250792 RepID=UPI001C05D1BA|nr:protein CCSMST1 [Melanotaenia boesemani]